MSKSEATKQLLERARGKPHPLVHPEERKLTCPRCHTKQEITKFGGYRKAQGSEKWLVDVYRCYHCGEVFAPLVLGGTSLVDIGELISINSRLTETIGTMQERVGS